MSKDFLDNVKKWLMSPQTYISIFVLVSAATFAYAQVKTDISVIKKDQNKYLDQQKEHARQLEEINRKLQKQEVETATIRNDVGHVKDDVGHIVRLLERSKDK